MPGYTASHVKDDEDHECPEVVGSTDLREVFKEKERIRGSFSINGHMFHQFESNSIANCLAQLNDQESRTHVVATIDDGYHLVLLAKSGAPIVIHRGPAYVEITPPGTDPVAQQVVDRLKAEAKERYRDEDVEHPAHRNMVLEDLGIPETEVDHEKPETLPDGTPMPGMTAEDRQKRREHHAKIAKGEIPADTPEPALTPPPASTETHPS